ncbi:serine/threonine protein kinase [Nannizzia gypsea CBS 118893]|uniref:Serine/threonine protein kinase n=1 Tax=Arthroderma gypseum (strain ATCC MYA-4604 / CBS 118893) TaxID=535722 RepID=E4V784_ARTGP|nr:serine/threonine protein kinase [Nannizzia gypsea CBS 118893]EFQ96950.1 serine/threonine protein kinase [Nannizzia gypsea CBS 118893]
MDIFNTAAVACEIIYKTLDASAAFPIESRSLAARFQYDARILHHFCEHFEKQLLKDKQLDAKDKALLEESTSYLTTLLNRVETCKNKLMAQGKWPKELNRLTWILRRSEVKELESELFEWTRRFDLRLVALPKDIRTVMDLDVERDDSNIRSFTPRLAARMRLERFTADAAAARMSVWKDLEVKETELTGFGRSDDTQRFALGTFRGSTVLVELRNIQQQNFCSEAAWTSSQASAGEFAAALNCLDSTVSGLLKCTGFFYSPIPAPSFVHMYLLPREKQISGAISSFKDLLKLRDAGGRRQKLLYTLNERLEFAKRLATAVMFVHGIGWVHKAITSQNVLLVGRRRSASAGGQEDTTCDRSRSSSATTKWSLSSPYLVGFEVARNNDSETIPSGPRRLPLARSLYLHPALQGDDHVRFNMAYDVYSLGVILLELGIWGPLEERPELKGIPGPEAVAEALYALANETEIFMGKRYREVVQTCLSQDAENETGSMKAISEILERLEDLAQGV